MISTATVDYCERCRCKTVHIPMPSGERVCEWHLGEAAELGDLATPARPPPATEPLERERTPA